ncbi:MAG: hypothetical protein M1817_002777 [Caeruleum heppii]|nr:MAG: hypothetical protein M1817_002777 [Caeruleum heppii]
MPNFPYPSPPTPAPGPSLLDDSESHMLGDFFDHVSSATFDNSSFLFDKQPSTQGMSNPFGWGEELPPTFHGTTTSLSQPPLISNGMHEVPSDGRSNHYNSSAVFHTPAPSDDVLAAAHLLQSGHSPFVGQTLASPESPIFPGPPTPHDFVQIPRNHQPSLRRQSSHHYHHPSQMQRPSSMSSHHRASTSGLVTNYYPNAMYGPNGRQSSGSPTIMQRQSKSVDVRWGSDVSFLDHGYVAPPNQETEEDVTKDMMHNMKALLPHGSASNTRPPSPKPTVYQHQRKASNLVRVPAGSGAVESSETEEEAQQSKRRNKRKVKEEDEGEEEDGSESPGKMKRRKRVAASGKGARAKKSSAEENCARQRSQSASHKAARENLTEEQKRSNHILSEQKRRNLIKQGFDDLCDLVPDLKGGGYSKSAMLVQAADWLEDMLRGNTELEAVLASLGGCGS